MKRQGVLALLHGQICFKYEMSTSICVVHSRTSTLTTAFQLCFSVNAIKWCLTHHVWHALSNRIVLVDLQMSSPFFRAGMLGCFRTMMQRRVKQDLSNLLSIMALAFTKPGHLLGSPTATALQCDLQLVTMELLSDEWKFWNDLEPAVVQDTRPYVLAALQQAQQILLGNGGIGVHGLEADKCGSAAWGERLDGSVCRL